MRETKWRVVHDVLEVKNGLAVAKHPLIARAGAEIMEAGGNAVDGAVAAAFTNTVVEPYMSGIGGVGFMMVHLARENKTVVVSYPGRAALAAHERMYELEDGVGSGFLPWRKVKDETNVFGALSVAVPGTVAGLCLAHERYGRLPLAQVMAPAIRLAAEGFPVGWHTSLMLARALPYIKGQAETARIWLDNGYPRATIDPLKPALVVQKALAATLSTIAQGGADAFYRGVLTPKIVEDIKAAGGIITAEDLESYRAEIVEPLEVEYRGHRVCTVPGASGGATMAQILHLAQRFDLAPLRPDSPQGLHLLAECMRLAFADRFRHMGDDTQVPVPWQGLFNQAYRDDRADTIRPDRALEEALAGDPWRYQEAPPEGLPTPSPDRPTDDCTTHLGTMDAEGNMVSCTQTSVMLFGSGITLPQTGVLLNNGMLWFDPEPGRVNSVGPGKRGLINMAPALVLHGGEPLLTIGSSGGRKIIGSNAQIISNIIDHGLGLQQAIDAPRVDASTPQVLLDDRLPREVIEHFERLGHRAAVVGEAFTPRSFSSPVGVLRDPDTGLMTSGLDSFYPTAGAGF